MTNLNLVLILLQVPLNKHFKESLAKHLNLDLICLQKSFRLLALS
jgi:hypothetical protein